MVAWVNEGKLARASRPGYESRDFSRASVDRWIAEARALNIQSILCLLTTELQDYADGLREEGGLLAYYRSRGFTVYHVPVTDHAQPPLAPEELERVAEVFRSAPRPMLIHCSAGIDRTGAAIAHIE